MRPVRIDREWICLSWAMDLQVLMREGRGGRGREGRLVGGGGERVVMETIFWSEGWRDVKDGQGMKMGSGF